MRVLISLDRRINRAWPNPSAGSCSFTVTACIDQSYNRAPLLPSPAVRRSHRWTPDRRMSVQHNAFPRAPTNGRSTGTAIAYAMAPS
jgi:hypothetical protein